MRLILIGPPGSGKGTQAKLLHDRLGLVHIATGDILREAIQLGTPAGKKAEPHIAHGQLAPDDLVNEVVADRLRRDDCPARFVLDGYPRTLAQAQALDPVLRELRLALDAVVLIDVPDEVIVRRLGGRRICPRCQTSYHLVSNPPRVPGVCDQDGTPLIQRPDDREETIRERLRIYRTNLESLIGHYARQGLVRTLGGDGGIEEIYQSLVALLVPA